MKRWRRALIVTLAFALTLMVGGVLLELAASSRNIPLFFIVWALLAFFLFILFEGVKHGEFLRQAEEDS